MAQGKTVGHIGEISGTINKPLIYQNSKAYTTSILTAGSGSSDRVTTATANVKFLKFYFENTATSGDNRGMYLRLYLGGTGIGGEAARIFTTIDDVAAGTAHGAHISLNFASTGSVTGLGVAMRATLHIPNDAGWAPGTVSALQAEIYADGSASDTDGATEVSFLRIVAGGTQAGIDDIEDDAFAISLQGFTAATGSLIELGTGMGTVTGTIKIKVGSAIRFLPFYSAAG